MLKNKTKMLVITLSLLLGVAACSDQPDGKSWGMKERCISGVIYYYDADKLAPAFKPDGSLFTCDTQPFNK